MITSSQAAPAKRSNGFPTGPGLPPADASFDQTEVLTLARQYGHRRIAIELCGWGERELSGKHTSCPIHGKTDPFRIFDDFDETGGSLCNDCGKFPNIVLTVGQYSKAGRSTKSDAFRRIAHLIGAPSQKRKRRLKSLTPTPENDASYRQQFANAKAGISEEAISRFGGFAALHSYNKQTFEVLAFPVWGHKFASEKPIGHVIARIDGGKLPTSGDDVKYKIVGGKGSGSGIIAPSFKSAAEIRASTEVFVKTEGLPDALAALTATIDAGIDKGLFIFANAAGAHQKPKLFMLEMAKGKPIAIIRDCDKAGQEGGEKWADSFASYASRTMIADPPLPLDGSQGKDLRDWFNQGNNGRDFQRLIKTAPVVEPKARALPNVNIGSDRPVQEVIAGVAEVLAVPETPIYWRESQPVQIVDGKPRVLSHHDQFAAAFSAVAECCQYTGEAVKFVLMPRALATTVIHRMGDLDGVKRMNHFTRCPVVTRDGRLIQNGFDAETGIYSASPAIKPADDIKTLTRLLDPFCFADDGGASRANAIAILLTSLLTPWFIGQMMIWLIVGNKPGIGKTILAQIGGAIRTGEFTPSMTYTSDDAEVEKQICGHVLRGLEYLPIDNAKTDRRTGTISSPVIERTTTDPVTGYRLLGTSKILSVENSLQFAITANSPDVSPDILDRSAITRLHYEGSTRGRNFEIDNPVAFTLENRPQILAELAGMIQRWIDGGMKESEARGRRNEWPRILGGILEANGIYGLLANADHETIEMDDERHEFAQLIEAVADHPEAHRRRPGEIADIAESHSMYQQQFFGKSGRAKSTIVGKLLKRYAGEKFEISNGRTATLFSDSDGNGNLYRVGIECENEEPETLF